VDKLGVYRHRRFGEDHPRVPKLQVCDRSRGMRWIGFVFPGENVTDMKCVALASDRAERTEELWEEYFADPSQWWDNRVDKVSQDCQWVDARKWM
jgi:hypothetical protein